MSSAWQSHAALDAYQGTADLQTCDTRSAGAYFIRRLQQHLVVDPDHPTYPAGVIWIPEMAA